MDIYYLELKPTLQSIFLFSYIMKSVCSVSGSSNGVYYKHITINNMTVTSTFMHFNLQDDQPLFSTHKVMTSYTSTQVRFVNAYKNCTLADLAGILLHPPSFKSRRYPHYLYIKISKCSVHIIMSIKICNKNFIVHQKLQTVYHDLQ